MARRINPQFVVLTRIPDQSSQVQIQEYWQTLYHGKAVQHPTPQFSLEYADQEVLRCSRAAGF
jgi:hypothetical protein